MIAYNPQLITARRFPQEIVPGQEDNLTPVSFGYQAWKIELARKTLSNLESFASTQLTEEQRINKEILRWSLEQMIDGERFLYHSVLNLNSVLELSVFMHDPYHPGQSRR